MIMISRSNKIPLASLSLPFLVKMMTMMINHNDGYDEKDGDDYDDYDENDDDDNDDVADNADYDNADYDDDDDNDDFDDDDGDDEKIGCGLRPHPPVACEVCPPASAHPPPPI